MQKSKKIKLFIALGVVLVLTVIVISNLKKSGEKLKVQTEKTTSGKIMSTVSGPAKIQPEIQVKISAQVSGQIVELGVKEGDSVKSRQFLVQLDPTFYRAVVEQNESNLKFARAGYEKSKNEYERAEKLFTNNLVSQADLDIAKSTYEQAKSQVEQMDAALKQAKDNLSKTTIFSPMDGTVSQLNKKVGEMAMGSQFTLDVIMVVADLSKMLAETDIDENDVVNVSVGDTAKITVDAYADTSFKGVVKEIANTGTSKGQGTQEEVTNFLVKVSMIEKPANIRPSMSATVDITTETRMNVLKIPIQCVTMRPPLKPDSGKGTKGKDVSKKKTAKQSEPDSVKKEGSRPGQPKPQKEEEPIKVVFLLKDNIAQQKPVITGITSDTEWEILSGLNEGDEVVSGSYRVLSKQIKDGDKVKVDNVIKKNIKEEK